VKQTACPQEQTALDLQQHGALTVSSQPGLAHHLIFLSLSTSKSFFSYPNILMSFSSQNYSISSFPNF
jgi:hypothetical protein